MPIFITTIHSKAGSDILYKASLSVNKSNEFIKLALRKCNLDYKYEVNNRNQFTIESGGLVITRAIQIAES